MEYIVVYLAFDNICQKILLTVVKIENFKKSGAKTLRKIFFA